MRDAPTAMMCTYVYICHTSARCIYIYIYIYVYAGNQRAVSLKVGLQVPRATAGQMCKQIQRATTNAKYLEHTSKKTDTTTTTK